MQRSSTILPIPDPQHVGLTTYDAKDPDTKFPPIEPLRPPKGAPNVLIVLLDDVGFAASSAFGGPIHTPTAERLAKGGLKFNRFHTTALCSPTRQALLTGRNHHSVNMGGICEIATVGARLQLGAAEEQGAAGDDAQAQRLLDGAVRQVPRGAGLGDQPARARSTSGRPAAAASSTSTASSAARPTSGTRRSTRARRPIEPEKTPEEGYHFTEDMTNKAIKWTRQQKALMPDKPFFMYFAPGACHAPHHVPKEWADKYKGKFDQGWDKLREEIFARQKKLGVIPADAELTARPAEIPAWDETPEDMRPIFAREMEVYAGFLEHTDHHLGRLVDALEGPGSARRHADLLHHRRQRRLGRRHAERLLQRDGGAERPGRPRDRRVPEVEDRRLRRPGGLQPLRGRLGARDGHALPVDQAGRLALGRHAQRHDRALAERHQGEGRGPQPVPSRDRRRADDPRSRRAAASDHRQQHPAGADRRRSACCTRSTTPRRRSGTRRSTSRCSATAASTTRAGRR